MTLEVRDESGHILFYHINAEQDWIRCECGVLVPQSQICTRCHRRTLGPTVENITRKLLTGEQSAKK